MTPFETTDAPDDARDLIPASMVQTFTAAYADDLRAAFEAGCAWGALGGGIAEGWQAFEETRATGDDR